MARSVDQQIQDFIDAGASTAIIEQTFGPDVANEYLDRTGQSQTTTTTPTKKEETPTTKTAAEVETTTQTTTKTTPVYDSSRDKEIQDFIDAGASTYIIDQTFGTGAHQSYLVRSGVIPQEIIDVMPEGIDLTNTADLQTIQKISQAKTEGERQQLLKQYQIDKGVQVTVDVDPFAFDRSRDEEIIDFLNAGATMQQIDQTFGAGATQAFVQRAEILQGAVESLAPYQEENGEYIDIEAAMRGGIEPDTIDLVFGEGTAAEYQQMISDRDSYEAAMDIISNYPSTQEGYYNISAAIDAGVDDAIIDLVFGEGTADKYKERNEALTKLEQYKDKETGNYKLSEAIDAGIDAETIDAIYGPGAYDNKIAEMERFNLEYVEDPVTGLYYDRENLLKRYGIAPGPWGMPTDEYRDYIDWPKFHQEQAEMNVANMLAHYNPDTLLLMLESKTPEGRYLGDLYEREALRQMMGLGTIIKPNDWPGDQQQYENWVYTLEGKTEDPYAKELSEIMSDDVFGKTPLRTAGGEWVTGNQPMYEVVEAIPDANEVYTVLQGTGKVYDKGITLGDIASYKSFSDPDKRSQWLTNNFTDDQIEYIISKAEGKNSLIQDVYAEAVSLGKIDTRTFNADDLRDTYDMQAQLISASMRADPEEITSLFNQGAFGGKRGDAYKAYVDAYNAAVDQKTLEYAVKNGNLATLEQLKNKDIFKDNPEVYDSIYSYVEEGGRDLNPVTQEEIDKAVVDTFGNREQFVNETLAKQPSAAELTTEALIAATPIVGTIHSWDEMSNTWRVISIGADLLTVIPFIGGMTAAARAATGVGRGARIAAASRAIPGLVWQEIKAPVTMLKAPIKTAGWAKKEVGGLVSTVLHPKGVPLSVTAQSDYTARLWIDAAGTPENAMKIRDILTEKVISGDLTNGLAVYKEAGKVYTLRPSRLMQDLVASGAHSAPDVREMVEKGIKVTTKEGMPEREQGLFIAEEAKPRFQEASAHGATASRVKIPLTQEAIELQKRVKNAKNEWLAAKKTDDISRQEQAYKQFTETEDQFNKLYDDLVKERIAYVEREWQQSTQLGNIARAEALADELAELEYRPMPGTKYLAPEEAIRATPTEKIWSGAAEIERHLEVGETIAPSADVLKVFGAQASAHGVPRKFDILDVLSLKAAGPYEAIRQILIPPLLIQRYIPENLSKYFKNIKLGAVDSAEEAAGYANAASNARAAGDIAAADELISIANVKQQRLNYIETLYDNYSDLVDTYKAQGLSDADILNELIAEDMLKTARGMESVGDIATAEQLIRAADDLRDGRLIRDLELAEDIRRTGTTAGLFRGSGEILRRKFGTDQQLESTIDELPREDFEIDTGFREEFPQEFETGIRDELPREDFEIDTGFREEFPQEFETGIRYELPTAEPGGRVPGRRGETPREPGGRVPGRRGETPREPGGRLPGGRGETPRKPGGRLPGGRGETPRKPGGRLPGGRVTIPRLPGDRTPPIVRTPVRVSTVRVSTPRVGEYRGEIERFRTAWKSGRDINNVPQNERKSISGWRQGIFYKILNTETGEMWNLTEDEKPDWVKDATGDDSAYKSFTVKGSPMPPYVVEMGVQRVYVTNKGLKFRATGG